MAKLPMMSTEETLPTINETLNLTTVVMTTLMETTEVTTVAEAEDEPWTIFGTRPEFVIVPCIILGIPVLILLYCLMKSALRKDMPTDDELWMKNKDFKIPDEIMPPKRKDHHKRRVANNKRHQRDPDHGTSRNSVSPIS